MYIKTLKIVGVKHRKKMYTIYTYMYARLKKIRSFGSLHFIHDVHYNVGGIPPPASPPFRGVPIPTYGTRTVINLWLYRVEINEPQYVITYVRNEHVVEIRFCPGPLHQLCSCVWLNNNFAGFVTVCNRFV